jgi:membrane protein implicated in regulation of membrane protease activity
MMYRQLNVVPRNRAAALALVVAAIVAGGMVLALGLSLLLGILALAAVAGAGVTLYRRIAAVLRGERPSRVGGRSRSCA